MKTRKALCGLAGALLAIAVYWLGFVNGVYHAEQQISESNDSVMLSDEEIMNLRIADLYGPEYYGVLQDSDDDDYIEFSVYSEDDVLCYTHHSNRDMCLQRYTD